MTDIDHAIGLVADALGGEWGAGAVEIHRPPGGPALISVDIGDGVIDLVVTRSERE